MFKLRRHYLIRCDAIYNTGYLMCLMHGLSHACHYSSRPLNITPLHIHPSFQEQPTRNATCFQESQSHTGSSDMRGRGGLKARAHGLVSAFRRRPQLRHHLACGHHTLSRRVSHARGASIGMLCICFVDLSACFPSAWGFLSPGVALCIRNDETSRYHDLHRGVVPQAP